jgi:hypothetical protein
MEKNMAKLPELEYGLTRMLYVSGSRTAVMVEKS